MKSITSILLLLLSMNSMAQCMMQQLSLDTKQSKAMHTLIVEVRSEHSFHRDKLIYTAYECEVKESESFQVGQSISVVIPGGRVGNEMWQVQPSFDLKPGDTRILFLNPSKRHEGEFVMYSGAQGSIKIHSDGTASDAFNAYPNPNEEVFNLLNLKYRSHKPTSARGAPAIVINGFIPDTITAGTASILEISGSGFGAFRGSGNVSFINANDGGGNARVRMTDDEFYLTWTDNKIRLFVPGGYPSVAGSGTVKIVTNFGDSLVSTDEIMVKYAVMELWDANTRKFANARLYEKNSFGGEDFVLHMDFNNQAGAVTAFETALRSLRCHTGVNFDRNGFTTDTLVGNDGKNIARFERGSELPDGTLGTTYLRFAGCQQGTKWHWWSAEADILFDTEADWNFNSALPTGDQMDFESVALHELGHAAMLAHVQSEDQMMFPTINGGQYERTPDTIGAKRGIEYVMGLSTLDVPCFGNVDAVSWFDTTACSFVGLSETSRSLFQLYPTITNNQIQISIPNHGSNQLTIYDAVGQIHHSDFDVSLETIDVSNYKSGVYILHVESEGEMESKRFVKY